MVELNDDNLDEDDGLCIADRREKMAREGDFQGLWHVLTDNSWNMIDQPDCFRLLLQAVEVAAGSDPRQFSAALFTKILTFSSYLLLRTHFQLTSHLERHDARMRREGNLPVPREVSGALPALLQLQEHLAALAESQARAARMWGLASKTRRSDAGREAAGEGPDQGGALPLRVASPAIGHAKEQA
jgi:hypothetical protein